MPRKRGMAKTNVRGTANVVKDHHQRFDHHAMKCPNCDVVSDTHELWVAHLDTHGYRAFLPQPCQFCPMWFHDEAELTEHLRNSSCGIQTQDNEFPDENFHYDLVLNVKEEPENSEESVSVEEMENSILFRLENPMPNFEVHPEMNNRSQPLMKNGIKNYKRSALPRCQDALQCSMCSRVLSSRHALEDHERVHRNEKPFACDLCDKSYCSAIALFTHKKIKHQLRTKLIKGSQTCTRTSRRARDNSKEIRQLEDTAADIFAEELLFAIADEKSTTADKNISPDACEDIVETTVGIAIPNSDQDLDQMTNDILEEELPNNEPIMEVFDIFLADLDHDISTAEVSSKSLEEDFETYVGSEEYSEELASTNSNGNSISEVDFSTRMENQTVHYTQEKFCLDEVINTSVEESDQSHIKIHQGDHHDFSSKEVEEEEVMECNSEIMEITTEIDPLADSENIEQMQNIAVKTDESTINVGNDSSKLNLKLLLRPFTVSLQKFANSSDLFQYYYSGITPQSQSGPNIPATATIAQYSEDEDIPLADLAALKAKKKGRRGRKRENIDMESTTSPEKSENIGSGIKSMESAGTQSRIRKRTKKGQANDEARAESKNRERNEVERNKNDSQDQAQRKKKRVYSNGNCQPIKCEKCPFYFKDNTDFKKHCKSFHR